MPASKVACVLAVVGLVLAVAVSLTAAVACDSVALILLTVGAVR